MTYRDPRAIFACFATVFLTCGSPCAAQERPPAERQGNAVLGLRIAESHCATCHAIGVSGESRDPRAPPFRNLSKNYPLSALEEAFAEGILVGHPNMPEFVLRPDQISDLLAYMQRVQVHRGG